MLSSKETQIYQADILMSFPYTINILFSIKEQVVAWLFNFDFGQNLKVVGNKLKPSNDYETIEEVGNVDNEIFFITMEYRHHILM